MGNLSACLARIKGREVKKSRTQTISGLSSIDIGNIEVNLGYLDGIKAKDQITNSRSLLSRGISTMYARD